MRTIITLILTVSFSPQLRCAEPIVTQNEFYATGSVVVPQANAVDTTGAMYLSNTLRLSYLNAAQTSYSAYIQDNDLQLSGDFDNGRNYQVVLYNVIGTKIFTGNFTAYGTAERLDMGRDIKPGIYIVCLTQPGNTSFSQVIKVVKQ